MWFYRTLICVKIFYSRLINIKCTRFYPQSPKLKTGYHYETQVSGMGLGSFVDINIFVMD